MSGTTRKIGSIAALFGGTRNVPTGLLQRKWQDSPPVFDPRNCPFCTKEQKLVRSREAGEWLELNNAFTPYPWHRLFIPKACWTMDKLYNLGGKEQLGVLFRIAQETAEEVSNEFPHLWLGTHVGYGAGQSVATHHVHHHLLSPVVAINGTAVPDNKKPDIPSVGDESLALFKTEFFEVFLSPIGVRAGQCLIFPRKAISKPDAPAALASVINDLIETFATKFRSMQWLPPDYMLAFVLYEGRFLFGTYIPILNSWGFPEYLTLTLHAMSEKNRDIGAITLPCPQEIISEHIRNS